MKIRILSIIVVLVVIGASYASAVETREIDQLVVMDPYYPNDFTSTINWSDPASASLSNYNSTVVPFMDESGVNGTFTGSFMPPLLAQVSDNTTATASWVSCIARFKSDWVMSGSSYSWWRVPIQNISDFTAINLTIWHLDNPPLINITNSYGDPNEATRPMNIYSNLYNPDGDELIWYNQTVTAWDYEWNFTWLRVVAPIHSDESYYVRFMYWHSDLPSGHEIMFVQTDVGDDQITKSWFYRTEVLEFDADLDISVIHEYGMGYGVSGFEVPVSNLPFDRDFITESITPTGSTEGLDGDWSSSGVSVQIDTGDKVVGTLSIKGNDVDYGQQMAYNLDSAIDLTTFDELNFWIKAESAVVDLRIYLYSSVAPDYDRAYKLITIPSDTWTYVSMDLKTGWTDEAGGLDISSVVMLRVYPWTVGEDNKDIWIDNLYFVGNLSIKFYSSTSTPIENGQYLTFMMPFFYDISTSNNVLINISSRNLFWSDEWWVAVDDNVTDFSIHSSLWDELYSYDMFVITVTFTNKSNLLYIWDQFSDFYIYDDDWSSYQENRFYCTNHPWAPDYLYYFHFTPYHVIQVADGEWVNTILDPIYELDGRYYSEFKFETVEHSDPWYIQILYGVVMIPYLMYTILDKVIFVDILPNLDLETYLGWFSTVAHNLKSNPLVKFIVSIGMFIWEIVQFVVKWAPYVLAALLKGLNLFIFIPVWITCILIFNGLKRYFVVMARDGPEAASDYADEFLKNCVKYVKSQPIGRVAGRFR